MVKEKREKSPTKRGLTNVFVFPQAGQFPQDDATLQRMASEIHSVIGKPLIPSGKTNNDPMDEKAATVPTEVDTWISNLSTSPAGQKLLDHLSHMEAAPHIKTSSAIEQVSTFRRVFIHALSKTRSPFGLPKKMPKYIAIVNFSGERLMMHSNNPNLITYLALGSSGLHVATSGIHQILSQASVDDNMSVVMYYSLPFQMSYETAHWECRTLVCNSNKTINDGTLVCCCWDSQAREGSLTTLVEAQHPDILEEQHIAFENNIKAVDLDFVLEHVDGINPALVTDEQNAKLMKLISVLKNERRKMLVDHRQEINDIKSKHSDELKQACTEFKSSVDKQKLDEDVVLELKSKIQDLHKTLADKNVEIQQLKSDIMLKEETAEKANRVLKSKIELLENENDSLKSNTKRIESGHGDALRKQEVVHQQMHDEAERKLQMAKQYESMAKEADARVNAVEKAFEKVSNEKTFVSSQVDILRKQLVLYRLRFSIQLGRTRAVRAMVNDARMLHAQSVEDLAAFKKSSNEEHSSAVKENLAMKTKLEEFESKSTTADQKMQQLTIELHDLKIQLADSERPEDVSTSVTGVEKNVETVAVQTDILQETLKLGELETESVKLQDEITNLKTELARAKSRNNKRNALMGTVAEEHTSPSNVLAANTQTINITGNASQDAFLEGAIQQLQATLNTVTELARQSKVHEQNARDAWSKLNVYENMNAYNPPYQPQPPSVIPQQHYAYMHPIAHGHAGMQPGMF